MYPYIQFWGLKISSYGMMMCVACVIVGAICLRRAKLRHVLAEDVLIVAAFAIGFGLFCGGLLFVFITYPVEYIWQCIINGQYHIFLGGIVFYGGLIGGVLGALLGCKVARCSVDAMIRVVVPYIPLGHGIGRIGCVLAGCCYGIPYEGPLAIHISANPRAGYFPVQLVEAVINIGICAALHRYERKAKPISLLALYLVFYAVVRFGLEFVRGDEIRGIAAGLSSSQWISVMLIGISMILFLLEYFQIKKHR